MRVVVQEWERVLLYKDVGSKRSSSLGGTAVSAGGDGAFGWSSVRVSSWSRRKRC